MALKFNYICPNCQKKWIALHKVCIACKKAVEMEPLARNKKKT